MDADEAVQVEALIEQQRTPAVASQYALHAA
ncbi:hypothetical protein W911_06065 [Hyphomicrobium nitrativorans NL23]|uniref:Uncharacterized protein n=1 Tax=Hyphomicrobium nitrativorans NL23 TaxID=1029756 RepID=V5SIW0_9HYPH|nr:hypothetical protein W911_06065 [Hyphomicrobium nitrativorans NL23]